MKINPEMNVFYKEHGYLLLDNVFTSARINAAKKAIDEIQEGSHLNKEKPSTTGYYENNINKQR